MRRPGGELHDGDVGARLGEPRLVLGHPEEVQGTAMVITTFYNVRHRIYRVNRHLESYILLQLI